MNSINLSKSAAFSLQTWENNLKPPKNLSKRHIKVQWNMATRGSYVHNSMVEYSGESRKYLFYAIFSENWWFQTNRFTGLLELIQLYKQNPLETFFHFHHLPKLYMGFKHMNIHMDYITCSRIKAEIKRNITFLMWIFPFVNINTINIWTALHISTYNQLRTRRALSLYKVYGNSALLVLNETLMNSISALLLLMILWHIWQESNKQLCSCKIQIIHE